MIHMLKLANQRIGQLNQRITELQDVERPIKRSKNRNNNLIVSSLQNALKEKDQQLKGFYDKLNQQKDQFTSEMGILKNHNKELKKNLIKQVAINKMQSKFTISITNSINEGKSAKNASMFDIDSYPSSMKSSTASLHGYG